jgi:hypothetical protein
MTYRIDEKLRCVVLLWDGLVINSHDFDYCRKHASEAPPEVREVLMIALDDLKERGLVPM